MSTSVHASPVESAIQRTTRRLRALEQIQGILAEFPDLAEELGIGNGRIVDRYRYPVVISKTVNVGKRASNYGRIKNYFIEHSNEWDQAPRIAEALGMSRGTVATVLWNSHKDKFEQAPVAGSVKKKKWRLRPDVILNDPKEEDDK